MKNLAVLYFLFITWCDALAGELTEQQTEKDENIHQLCQNEYANCLTQLPQFLKQTPKHSRIWFAFKLYQLEALFALEKIDQLEQELAALVNLPNLPVKFQIHAYIHWAKVIKSKGDVQLAQQYFDTAKTLALEANRQWHNPMEVIRIANLLNASGQYQASLDTLVALEQQHGSSKDPNFQYSLYTNLGHSVYFLGDLDKHIAYRFLAEEWAQQTNNANSITIATFNIARAHLFVDKLELAERYFQRTVPWAEQAKNVSLANKININLADIAIRQSKFALASEYLNKVDTTQLAEGSLSRYQSLAALIEKSPADSRAK